MSIVRKIFLVFSSFMLLVTLMLINTLWTTSNTLGERAQVKAWLDQSGFYENVIDEVAKLAEEEVAKQAESTPGSFDATVFLSAAENVFTPENIQEKTELVLDSTYNWLEGDSPNIDFVIDLEDEKNELARSLVTETEERLATLPECSLQELQTINSAEIFTLNCRPPLFNELADEFRTIFVSSSDFLPDATFQSSDLKITVNGTEKSISEAFSAVPAWYGFAKTLAWIVIIFGLFWVALVLFLSKNLRYGVKHLAVIFTVAAVFTISSVVGFKFAIETVEFETITTSSELAQPIVETTSDSIQLSLLRQVSDTLLNYGIAFSLIYTVLALAGYAYIFFTRGNKKPATNKDSSNEQTDSNKPEQLNDQSASSNDKAPQNQTPTDQTRPQETIDSTLDSDAKKVPPEDAL